MCIERMRTTEGVIPMMMMWTKAYDGEEYYGKDNDDKAVMSKTMMAKWAKSSVVQQLEQGIVLSVFC